MPSLYIHLLSASSVCVSAVPSSLCLMHPSIFESVFSQAVSLSSTNLCQHSLYSSRNFLILGLELWYCNRKQALSDLKRGVSWSVVFKSLKKITARDFAFKFPSHNMDQNMRCFFLYCLSLRWFSWLADEPAIGHKPHILDAVKRKADLICIF